MPTIIRVWWYTLFYQYALYLKTWDKCQIVFYVLCSLLQIQSIQQNLSSHENNQAFTSYRYVWTACTHFMIETWDHIGGIHFSSGIISQSLTSVLTEKKMKKIDCLTLCGGSRKINCREEKWISQDEAFPLKNWSVIASSHERVDNESGWTSLSNFDIGELKMERQATTLAWCLSTPWKHSVCSLHISVHINPFTPC